MHWEKIAWDRHTNSEKKNQFAFLSFYALIFCTTNEIRRKYFWSKNSCRPQGDYFYRKFPGCIFGTSRRYAAIVNKFELKSAFVYISATYAQSM